MKMSELREKSKEDLGGLLVDLHKEQFNLRVQRSLQQPVKTHKFKEARRNVARIKMILGQKGE